MRKAGRAPGRAPTCRGPSLDDRSFSARDRAGRMGSEMQRTRTLAGLAILTGLAIASTEVHGQTPRFEEFAHRFRPATGKQEQGLPSWSWPPGTTFATRFERYQIDACPWKVLHANFRLYSGRNEYTWKSQAHLRTRKLDDIGHIRLVAGPRDRDRGAT